MKSVEIDDNSKTLFNDVYATPNQAYNRLNFYALDCFNLHAYHSQQTFMEAYRSSRTFKFLDALDKERREWVAFKEEITLLNTQDIRAKHIKKASDKYLRENAVQK